MTTLGRLAFIRDPKLKIGAAITLVYPPEWLNEKPSLPDMMEFETNKDMAISLFLARIARSRPQTFAGNMAQTAACLRHYVSDERLQKIKESGVFALVMTGTWDNLVNPKNSYYLSEKIGCSLEVFEGSGHGLPGEQSVRYNKTLDDHFTKAIALRNNK